ncbi:MAG: rhomboid family intramembrane serine protease [Flavobacteriales bacterium]|nr:rhomboid family intramembrane serine protease [Flavobacteriales bacterium]NNK81314.1 rhomboid family intramembrane serine protease [Flavobacteriales bacterium]
MSLTLILVVITVAVSLISEQNYDLKRKLLFNAYDIKHSKEWYRWLTHGFVHGGFLHLAINMWVFYMFGQMVEETFNALFEDMGRFYFLTLYLVGIVASSISSFIKHQDNPGYNSLGASGAVASIMFVFILFYPTSPLYLFFIPVGIPAFLVGILYLWYESYMSKKGGTMIAHDAHFWGAVFGVAFIVVLAPQQLSDFVSQVIYYVQSFAS